MNKKIFSENCNLSNYTTIKVGGVAEYFAEPRSIEEFSYLIEWANLNKKRCQIIGAGSNLLINNIFIKGLVVCTKKLKSLKIEPYSGIVEAEAGVMLPTLSNSLAKNGLQGGEWAVGIPGTLGGAIYMNAGTGDLSLAKNLISVIVINNKTLEKLELKKKDIKFEYRGSNLSKDLIFLSATFKGKKIEQSKIVQSMEQMKNKKEKTQPTKIKTGGSTFKNPIGQTSKKVWELIKESVPNSLSFGDAIISEKHMNFFVNRKNASFNDMKKLIFTVHEKVKKKTGIKINPEIEIIE